ncbi:GntT/GntP/DsdX family permease [Novacetimonas pomaceti]|uniref:GntT/GntP/DsdX family permease n=1 Tax=Novacetimonas pomaceti TaxID=2021998 RepID=UPI001C2D0853|nr:gluconate:H+ symporter [Novacetimonas pomaceti]MBV1833018.1 GntP family permease [Novacetimonas pomaceti]
MSVSLAFTIVAVSIAMAVVLIQRGRLHPFIALFLTSLFLGTCAGMAPAHVISAFENGAGEVLGQIASVIALGAMLGKMLEVSGGADQIALTVVRLSGRRNMAWAMMLIGLLVGISVFFTVGFVILVPLAMSVARQTGLPMLRVALPMTAALSVVQGLVPPHPGAMFALAAYHADVGRLIVWGILLSIPIAIIAGPLYAGFVVPRLGAVPMPAGHGEASQGVSARPGEHPDDRPDGHALPSFGITLLTILAPVVLMLGGSIARLVCAPDSLASIVLRFVGDPNVGMVLSVLLSFYTLGARQGLTRQDMLRLSNESLAPLASLFLMIGAGGGFGQELMESNLSAIITGAAIGMHIPLLLLAWLMASALRLAVGSATVAMGTTAGVVGPIMLQGHGVSPELMVLATGSGAVMFGPLNDSGFWQVKEALGMTVPQTIATWSVIETLIGVSGLILCAALWWMGMG